jgi:hypothetical protein
VIKTVWSEQRKEILSILCGKLMVKETTEAMRYSAFMSVEDISARYLNLTLWIGV